MSADVPHAHGTFGVDPARLHEMVADVDRGVHTLRALGGVTGLARKLRTSVNKGLTVPRRGSSTASAAVPPTDKASTLLQERVRVFGENRLPDEEDTTFWDFVKESLEDRMLQILIVSAVASLALGLLVPSHETGKVDYAHGWVDGAAILLSVALVTAVSSINNYQKEQKFKELSAKKPAKVVTVLRNGGAEHEVLDSELLVGDLLLVRGGDVLDVDGVVVRATQLKTDESAVTGENDDVAKVAFDDVDDDESVDSDADENKSKSDKKADAAAAVSATSVARRQGDCIVRSGTNVVEGEGTILVTGVGVHSFAGTIAMEVRREKEETPLQEKLTVLADQIGYLGMAAAFLMFTILSAKEVYDTLVARTHPFSYKKYLDNLMTAVTIVVVAVPEGLPLSVTIALAYSMKQMFKENNLVRHLAACETMGGATTICTDKTGTITQNEMTVTDGFTSDGTHFIVPFTSSSSSSASPTTALAHQSDANAKLFSEVFPSPSSSSAPASAGAQKLRALLVEGIAVNTRCERKGMDDSPPPASSHAPAAAAAAAASPTSAPASGSKLTGNKTEQALLGFVERLGEDPFAVRANLLRHIRDVTHAHPPSHAHASGDGAAAGRGVGESAENDVPTSSSPTASSGSPSPSPQPPGGDGQTASTLQKEMRTYPFTSARKRMTTAFVLREPTLAGERRDPSAAAENSGGGGGEGVVRYHVKGASELLLQLCTHVLDADGTPVPMPKETRIKVEAAILSMARRRLRTLALAYAEVDLATAQQAADRSAAAEGGRAAPRGRLVLVPPPPERTTTTTPTPPQQHPHRHHSHTAAAAVPAHVFPDNDSTVAEGGCLPPLTFLGLVGIRDPVRPEVPLAIARCRRAGVTVRMITGDNKATAIAIAREVGIYGPVWFSDRPCYRGGQPGSGVVAGEQGLALEGREFRAMARSARTLNAILPKLQVISRASPLDKQILVAALMERGEVVAVTGDGTNDAPALKNASVGFSMNSGTEVAKTASDVVILDDNFSTIVTAMKWGRNVHDNISKFLQFQMTVNVAAVVVSFLGSLFDAAGEAPLKPVQLLWVNLIMDTLAALALATEGPAEAVLDRSPKPKNAPLLSLRMWTNILGQSAYQIALQLWLLQRGHLFFNVPFHSEQHLSAVFNVFVLLQLFNEFNARILDTSLAVHHGIHRAPLFLLVVGTCFLVQVVGVQYGGSLMRAAPLSRGMWIKCLQLSIVPLPLGVLLRCVPVTERAVPPPPMVVDADEEQGVWEAAQQRRRPTLKEAARTVVRQLRIVKALKAAKSKDGMTA